MKMSKENYERFAQLIKAFAESCRDEQHINTMVKFAKNEDIKNPVIAYIWQVFFSTRYVGGALISAELSALTEGLVDSHIETALLKWYNSSRYSTLLQKYTR
jgi:hypothetical protein